MKVKFIGLLLGGILLSPVAASAGFVEEDLGKIVVTATRIAQNDYKISSDVTVITREEIEASNAQNVPDVLEEALAVFVYDKNTAKTATLDIRGFGDTASRNVLVLLNDRKLNAIDMSAPDLMQIPIGSVEKIEIVRGAGSVLYGDNAVGGVVNIITKQGKGDLSGRVGAHYGSYDSQGADVEVSGEYKNVSYYLYSKYDDQRGYRENSDVISKSFTSRLGYKLTDKVSMDFSFGHHQDSCDLPGGLDESELKTLSRRGSADKNNMANTNEKYYQLGFDIEPDFEDSYVGNFSIDLHYRDRDAFDSFGGYDTDRDIVTKGITAKYIFDKTLFGQEINFVTGIDYYETENNIVGSGTNTDDLVISKDEFGVYGFLQYEALDHLFVNGGTRYHRADYAFSKHDVVSDEHKHPDEVVSMGGLKYEYAEGSNVFMSYQQTFRFLVTDEWYSTYSGLNTGLKQQTGVQYEIGIKHNFNDKVMLGVTPYWIDNKNEIFYDPNAGLWGDNSNYDKTRRVGIETDAEVDVLKYMDLDFLDKLVLFTNYTYQVPEFNGGTYDGKDIPLVPRHQASIGVRTGLFDFLNISLTGKYVGSRYIINDVANEMAKAKDYFVMDAKLGFEKEDFEVYLGVENLFNELYAPYQVKKTSATRDIYPAPETNYTFGINYRF